MLINTRASSNKIGLLVTLIIGLVKPINPMNAMQ